MISSYNSDFNFVKFYAPVEEFLLEKLKEYREELISIEKEAVSQIAIYGNILSDTTLGIYKKAFPVLATWKSRRFMVKKELELVEALIISRSLESDGKEDEAKKALELALELKSKIRGCSICLEEIGELDSISLCGCDGGHWICKNCTYKMCGLDVKNRVSYKESNMNPSTLEFLIRVKYYDPSVDHRINPSQLKGRGLKVALLKCPECKLVGFANYMTYSCLLFGDKKYAYKLHMERKQNI
jgi:hypothetical protein